MSSATVGSLSSIESSDSLRNSSSSTDSISPSNSPRSSSESTHDDVLPVRSLSDSTPALGTQIGSLMARNLSNPRIRHSDVLTSADKELILINSNEYHYSDGEVVFRQNDENADESVYWIVKGYLRIEDQYGTIASAGPAALIKNRKKPFQAVAHGDLVIRQLEYKYIQALMTGDDKLALRFFRRLATNSALILRTIFERMNAELSGATPELPRKVRTLSGHKIPQTIHSKPTGQVFRCMIGDQHVLCHIKNTKLKLAFNTLGLRKKLRLKFVDIIGVSRSSDLSVTIVTKNRKGKTLFFEEATNASHLQDLLSNILARTSSPSVVVRPHAPLSSSTPRNSLILVSSTSSTVSSADPSSDTQSLHSSEHCQTLSGITSYSSQEEEEDKTIIKSISELKTYHRGDRIVSEGDLYQRIYQIEKGRVEFSRGGVALGVIPEGESFGEVGIVQLRPYDITITAASDVVEVRVVTGNKLFQIIDKNPRFGARLYRDITNSVMKKVCRALELRKTRKEALLTSTNDHTLALTN